MIKRSGRSLCGYFFSRLYEPGSHLVSCRCQCQENGGGQPSPTPRWIVYSCEGHSDGQETCL